MVIAPRSSPSNMLRIFFTDADATESSSEEEFHSAARPRQVKRQAYEFSFDDPAAVRHKPVYKCSAQQPEKRFRGVRQRTWGSAEIRDSIVLEKSLWLGTFESVEEAASIYDLAAVTKFPIEKKDKSEAGVTVGLQSAEFGGGGEASPQSVRGYGEEGLRFEDCLVYGDVDVFGFRVEEETLCVPESCYQLPDIWNDDVKLGDSKEKVLGRDSTQYVHRGPNKKSLKI